MLWVGLPVLHIASATGGWLFFIQHQFEETTWDKAEGWDFQVAALLGSSYYKMPRVLNWFTGNIGLHHIHHLNSMIPNYRLHDCLDASPELKSINRLTLRDSIRCARLKLWDERSAPPDRLRRASGVRLKRCTWDNGPGQRDFISEDNGARRKAGPFQLIFTHCAA